MAMWCSLRMETVKSRTLRTLAGHSQIWWECEDDLMVCGSFVEPNMRTSEISVPDSVRATQERTVTKRNRNTTLNHHSNSVQDEHRQQMKFTSFIFPSACTYSSLHFDNVLQKERKRERGTWSYRLVCQLPLSCPSWSAHCMRVIAKGWALPNRLAHTAGSFLIRSQAELPKVRPASVPIRHAVEN